MNRNQAHDLYRRYVNPDFVKLLEALDFGRCYVRAVGTRLWDDRGREYTDFLAGYGVHNLGHNPPAVVAALQSALQQQAPSMLNVDAPAAAGQLAERLCAVTAPALCRTAYANSGAEAVEIALKAARLATGRPTVLYCHGGFHGLTTGAAALLGEDRFRAHLGLGSMGSDGIPFNDLAALRRACETLQPAALVVEPIQAEGGINVPTPDYLPGLRELCTRHGVLLVVDEIQTGLGRTGRRFAADLERVQPDILLLGKALSGGLVPVAATMMTAAVWRRAFDGPERCLLTGSTFAGNHLAMTAALATLESLEHEGLATAAAQRGTELLAQLQALMPRHSMVRAVRGTGLLVGIEFQPPAGFWMRLVPAWARPGLFAHVVAAELLHRHAFLTQPCSLAPGVLRCEPPLTVSPEEIQHFTAALDETLTRLASPRAAVFRAVRGWR